MYLNKEGKPQEAIQTESIGELVLLFSQGLAASVALQRRIAGVEPPKVGD